MKKFLCLLLSFLFLLTSSPMVIADEDISVIVNDLKLNFDVPPYAENGRTLVPLRAIFEALGAGVDWDVNTGSAVAVRQDTTVKISPDSKFLNVNGNLTTLDVPAKAVSGRILVPVRAISEAFGCDVSWNPTLKTVHISEDKTLQSLGIPEYFGKPYAVINNNVPYFDIKNYSKKSFEMYLPLDHLGRCTYAMSMLGKETMPTEDRGQIGSVTPSGWHSVKYDIVDGNYLYNRCHLIGYQLSSENANENNLLTGTRYMNVDGMLPFEDMIADYIKKTGNHVLYRVTPVFENNNLIASGVTMEAMSFEDNGKGISFNVFCYNVQPGITINYKDGTSKLASNNNHSETDTTTMIYILNISSKKIHYPTCSSVTKMKEENKKSTSKSKETLISEGYSPCGICMK